MGIKEKGFADWVTAQFPSAVRVLPADTVSSFSHVLIDMNPLLHTNLRTAKDEKQCIKRLFAELDRLLRLTQPTSLVYLAVDGAPPLAKMKEQIRRRRSRAPSKEKRKLDSSQITPGCAFMQRVTAYLHYYAARFLASYKNRSGRLRFIVDGAETEGEGEAKIMAYLAAHAAEVDGNVAVYSGDSDVVVQSLLSPIARLFVVRYSPDQIVTLSMRMLRQLIAMPDETTNSLTHYRHLVDSVFLILFSGNDYLPKLRGAKISKIWPIYRAFRGDVAWQGRHLISATFDTIDAAVFAELLQRIRLNGRRAKTAKGRSLLFKPDLRVLAVAMDCEADSFNAEELDDEEEEEDELEDGWTEFDRAAADMDPLFIKSLAPFKREPESVLKSHTYTAHIPDYLQSLFWCLHMYQHGRCPDYLFLPDRSILTLEQLLTFLARDLPNASLSFHPTAGPALPNLAVACALLGKHKAPLLPKVQQIQFGTDDAIRQLLFLMLFYPPTSHAQRLLLASLIRSQLSSTSFAQALLLSRSAHGLQGATILPDPLHAARQAGSPTAEALQALQVPVLAAKLKAGQADLAQVAAQWARMPQTDVMPEATKLDFAMLKRGPTREGVMRGKS